ATKAGTRPPREQKEKPASPPPPPAAAPAPVQPAPQPAQPAQPAKPDKKASVDELLKTADEIVQQTSALRQLAVKQPVKRGVLSRDAIREKLREQIARQYTS